MFCEFESFGDGGDAIPETEARQSSRSVCFPSQVFCCVLSDFTKPCSQHTKLLHVHLPVVSALNARSPASGVSAVTCMDSVVVIHTNSC